MKAILLFLTGIIVSCSSASRQTAQRIDSGKSVFYLKDRSGEFIVERSVKVASGKIVVKREVFSPNEMNEPLEKTITVASLGKVKTKAGQRPGLRPEVAQHTIWYEKNKFFSQLKVNPGKRALDAVMESPEAKWQGERSFPIPKGSVFCFFSQIPECAKVHGLLGEDSRAKQIQIIWDNYPYHQEMYEGVSGDPFERAVWAFDKKSSGQSRYGLLVGTQLILYEFDAEENFKNMFWVSQGISFTSNKE